MRPNISVVSIVSTADIPSFIWRKRAIFVAGDMAIVLDGLTFHTVSRESFLDAPAGMNERRS